MKATLTIQMDTAAFGDAPELELAEILLKLQRKVRVMPLYSGLTEKLIDTHGNTVGSLTIEEG